MAPWSVLCIRCGPGDNKSCEAQYIISGFMRCGTGEVGFLQLCVLGLEVLLSVKGLLTKVFPAAMICNTVHFGVLQGLSS